MIGQGAQAPCFFLAGSQPESWLGAIPLRRIPLPFCNVLVPQRDKNTVAITQCRTLRNV